MKSLPKEEVEHIGAKFTDPEAIFEAIEQADGHATVLLRASWLRKQHGSARLPRRGASDLPMDALIDASELRSIYSSAIGRVGSKQRTLPLIAVSHMWRSKEHAGPHGETLGILVNALEQHWSAFLECGVSDLGVFIDFSSLYQEPRTAEQDVIFRQSLKNINLWYAHQLTTVWLVTGGTVASAQHGGKPMGYADKGWTTF